MAVAHRIAPFFVWLWLATLLGASTGFSMRRIYCYCLGETVTNIFSARHTCTAPHKPAVELPPCCAVMEQETCTATLPACNAGDKDCTDTTVKVFKLKFDSLVETFFQKDFDAPVWLPSDPFFKKMLRPVICLLHSYDAKPPAPPPPLSGRTICLRHELLRC
jgi:hypothetical protein